MFRRVSGAIAATAVVLSGLVWSAAPASAAVTSISLDPTVWTTGQSSAATATLAISGGASNPFVTVDWDWGVTYQGAAQLTASLSGDNLTYTCQTFGVSFTLKGTGAAWSGATPSCKYSQVGGDPGTHRVTLVGATANANTTEIDVFFPEGVVTAQGSRGIWTGGSGSVDTNSSADGKQVTVSVVPVDSAGNPIPLITLNIDANGGTCNVSSVTGYQSTWASAPEASSCIKPGVFFTGFNTSPDGSGIAVSPGGNLHLTGDNTLYAIYEAPQTAAAPTDVVAVAGRNQIKVSWKAPVNTGSLPITNYLVQATPSGRTCITSTRDADMLTCTVSLSATNTKYAFTVQALNGAGWSDRSAASNAVSPFNLVLETATRPKANFLQGLVGWGSIIEMSGRAPGFAVGTAVIPQWKVGSGNWVSEGRAGVKVDSNHQVSWSKKLKKNLNGEAVTVRFVSGDVATDESALRVGSQAGLASAPRNVKFVVTEAKSAPARKLNVTWQPPANDGGSPITSYVVRAQLFDGSLPVTCRVDASKPLVCNTNVIARVLDPKKKYAVSVTAISNRGEGKPAKVTLSRPS